MPKLLCTGDLHLGAGSEYGRKPGDRLRDQEDVLNRIADVAIDEGVDGILIAGDTFNGPAAPPEQLAILARFIDRLQGRIPILAITGNGVHDLSMRETNGLEIFNHIDGITVHSQPTVVEFAGCAVATLPWVSPARLVAARNGGDRDEVNADVAQLLLDIAARGLEECATVAPGAPTILLGHWSVSGASLPNGLPVDQLREPVIPLADLLALGYDATVLGHIHAAQHFLPDASAMRIVWSDGSGSGTTFPHFYVGSPTPLNFGEADTAHGVWILDLPGGSSSSAARTDGSGRGHGQSNGDDPAVYPGSTPGFRSTFIPIESRPFVTLDYDFVDDERSLEQLAEGWYEELTSMRGIRDAIVRMRYRVTAADARSIDVAGIRRALDDAAMVKIQPDIVREERARVQGLDEGLDELAALDLYIDSQGIDPALADRMRDRTRQYLETA